MKKYLIIFALLFSVTAKSQTGCPLYSGINAWNTCINNTLINGANGGGTKLQVAMWLDTIAKYALLNTSSVSSFNTRTGAVSLTSGDVTTALGYTPVTNARTLTINGVTFDLSANRSWTISTLTSPLTTKGDVWVYGTADTRLPVGTDGQVLTAASGAVRGVQWSTPSSGTVTNVSGTTNRISVSSGTTTPVIDIDVNYAGQSSINTLGTITTGTWNGTAINLASYVTGNLSVLNLNGGLSAGATTFWRGDGTWATPAINSVSGVLSPIKGGTGVSNNALSTITISGAFGTTFTVTGTTSVTLPTSGTLVNTAVTTLSSLASIGTITTGVWNGTALTSAFVGSLTGGQVGISGLSATGTPSSSTYLRGDNTWATISGGMSNPMNTTGDVIYSSDNSGTPARLGIGSNNKFMTVISGLPAWSTSTIPTSAGATSGKILKSDGTNYILSTATFSDAPSTAGKIMVSDGTNWITSTTTFPNASATSRKKIVSDGTNWVASTETWATPSTASNFLMSDGTNWTSVSFQQYTSASNYTTSTTITSADCRTIFYKITAQAGALLFNNPTGTFCDGQILLIAIKDNGTARALTYGSNFRAGSSLTPLLATTTISKWAYLQFIYNSTDTKWDYIGAPNGF